MDDKVNLAEKLRLLDKPFSPGIVGYLNEETYILLIDPTERRTPVTREAS